MTPREFYTYDADLAAYLMLSGLKFVECILDKESEPRRVKMRFFDEKGIALDLERTYLSSDIARFRSFQKYLLKSIHRTMKGIT